MSSAVEARLSNSSGDGTGPTGPVAPVDARQPGTARRRSSMTAVLLAVVAILVLVVAASVAFRPAPVAETVTMNASYDSSAGAILSSTVLLSPAGYAAGSSGVHSVTLAGSRSAAWVLLGQPDGSMANATVIVYGSANSSQSYFGRFAAGVQKLSNYSDISSGLSAYQRYGKCYGYGQDVDGIGVANGICTKGNVFLEVHLVSTKPFPELEADLSSIMGALYQSTS